MEEFEAVKRKAHSERYKHPVDKDQRSLQFPAKGEDIAKNPLCPRGQEEAELTQLAEVPADLSGAGVALSKGHCRKWYLLNQTFHFQPQPRGSGSQI